MSKIIPKLNLNKTPQLVENNSLVYAKNIKLNIDGTISPDTSLKYIPLKDDYIYIGHIIGVNNIVYLFGIESNNSAIFEYNELDKKITQIECAWKWSGGSIDGIVTTNNTNEKILTICEYSTPNNTKVPIKHINLNNCSYNDDESIYTQNPNIPISNIINVTEYPGINIPNGVYQFFIRYEIKKDIYTEWFSCSKEIYVGQAQIEDTIQGSVKHIDSRFDSPNSFQFQFEHLNIKDNKFKKCQLGFIISNNDSVVARSWKYFSLPILKNNKSYISPTSIIFDYKNIEEIDIYELLKTHYEIFNVNNITYFKNKEYISNYIETDFNIDVQVEGNVKLETNNINLTSGYYIGNKPISNDGKLWDDKPIKDLLSNQKYVELNQLSLENISPEQNNKIPLIECTAEFNNDWTEQYNPGSGFSNIDHKRNIYTITSITKHFDINEDNLSEKDSTNSHLAPTKTMIGWGPTNTYLGNNQRCWIKGVTEDSLYYKIIGKAHLLYLQDDNGTCYFNNGDGFTIWGGPSDNFTEIDYNKANEKWLDLLNEYCVKNIESIIITKIELLDENNNLIQSLFDENNTTNLLGVQINNVESIKDKIIKYLTDEDIDININNSGIFCINNKKINSINVNYNKLTFEKNETPNKVESNYAKYSLSVVGKETNYIANYKLQVKPSTFQSKLNNIEDRTLMPLTDYEFYIHFVKQNGIITNGYKLGDSVSYNTYTNENALQQIYPNITVSEIKNLPKDYVAWFVSIYDPKYTIARTFNHWMDNEYHYLECLECDALLYNLTNNITIYQQDENGFIKCSDNGEYFSSSQTRELALFGNSGIIRFPRSDFNAIEYNDYEVITNNVNIPDYGGTLELQINFSLNNQIVLIPIKDINNLYNLHNNIINNELLKNYINYLDIDVQINNQSINDIDVSEYYIIDDNGIITAFTGEITEYTINEDEYEYKLKQLEIYNVAINNTNLATNIRSKQFEVTGGILGCGSKNNQPTATTNTKNTTNRDCPINPPTVLDLVVGSATADTLADASTITGEDIKSIKNYIDNYNDTLKNINDTLKNINDTSYYKITRIKNGKTTIEYSNNIILNTELLTKYKAKVIITSKAIESKNPIYAIYLNYNFNKQIDNYISEKTLKLTNTVIAKRLTNSFWIVQKPTIENIEPENKELIRITPYINITPTNNTYNNAKDMNLPAFLCSIMKPDFNTNNKYYVNGTDVYDRNLLGVNKSLDLNEGYIPFTRSDVFYTISNFNLNKLSLRENLTSQIRNIITETPSENNELTSTKETLSTQYFKAFNTPVISTIYELKSMYRDYIRPYYKIADATNNITKFDNTIRTSNINRDEAYFNIYKFDAENYYNIPTDRGVITKLFTILNEMFVHTEHALYKFAGNNNLKSTEGDVTLQQTDIFDTGIQPILDSNHGFAGLLKKHHGVITHNNYIFYDGNINKVFTLDTQNGISYITDTINKLLDQYTIDDVIIATDNQNDRVYINFIPSIIDENEDLNKGKIRPTLCLSYSFRSKAFVSIHDLTFESAFGTHRNTYLINSNNIYQTVPYIEIKDNKQYSYYDKCFVKSIISTEEESKNNSGNTSCIDILYNEYYETIKVLNHINWITAKLNSFNNNYMAEENLDYHYAGDSLKVYSDSCNTDLIPLNKIENDYNINDNNKHEFPRFNCGIWSLNYFRNIRNNNFNSNNQNIDENSIVNYSHDNSLIYGKYFVLRMLFDSKNNFKFENVNFNIENYDKV